MSYTDKFFKFPIKMYDVYSAINAEQEEDKQHKEEGIIQPIAIDYLVGVKVVLPETILGWVECYHKGQDPDDVIENGFPCTVITVSENQDTAQYECVWPLKKFEAELNKKLI
jgi:hypothetical protein